MQFRERIMRRIYRIEKIAYGEYLPARILAIKILLWPIDFFKNRRKDFRCNDIPPICINFEFDITEFRSMVEERICRIFAIPESMINYSTQSNVNSSQNRLPELFRLYGSKL